MRRAVHPSSRCAFDGSQYVAATYCDPAKAEAVLHWRATRTIDDACRDSWNWQSQNPAGYATA